MLSWTCPEMSDLFTIQLAFKSLNSFHDNLNKRKRANSSLILILISLNNVNAFASRLFCSAK